MSGIWDQLVDCICRPPRDVYDRADVWGGANGKFHSQEAVGSRKDLVVHNKKGQKLECSHFIPLQNFGVDGKMPCVVYCHCNSGSKRDAEEALPVLIPAGVSVFAFDFSGSGLSDGEHVTLGANEVEDLEAVVAYLRSTGLVSTLGLWGRSMGAVTALMYSMRDPSVAGMVLDSPFSRLTDLMLEIVEEQRLPIPKAVTKMVLGAMRKSVRKRADFDINTVAPLDLVESSFIPTLFGHGLEDSFIKIHHSVRLHEAYAGDKNLVRFPGDHNSVRPKFFYDSVAIFFLNSLRLTHMLTIEPGDTKDAMLALAREHARQQDPSPQRRRVHAQDAPPQLLDDLNSEAQTAAGGAAAAGPDGQLYDTGAEEVAAAAEDERWRLLEEADMRMAMELSMRDVSLQGVLVSTAPSEQPPSGPPPPAQVGAQRRRPAPAAEDDDDDDDDEQLRKAIAASLLESQIASLVPQPTPSAPQAPAGMLQSVAAKPAVPPASPQLAPGMDTK